MDDNSIDASRGGVNFETAGPTWAQRAASGELSAVFSPDGADRRNLYLHALSLYAANRALALVPRPGHLLDFGCGTGRMVRFFSACGWTVTGTEITREMLDEARRFGIPPTARLHATDGVAIPMADASVDLVWVCGVLKYSLFPPGAICRGGSGEPIPDEKPFVPVYRNIAREMYRVLKPGGWVVNNEVYVDASPDAFTRDFEDAGFVTKDVRVLQRYYEPFAKLLQSKRIPRRVVTAAARLYAARRYHFDDAWRKAPGIRDYLFAWYKP